MVWVYFLKWDQFTWHRSMSSSPRETRTTTVHPTIISYSEALHEFIGNWTFDNKLSQNIPGTVTAERIMKKARVPLTKRIGLQYFVGNDVSQIINIDEENGVFLVEAFVKGIPSWSKDIHLDRRKQEVKDPLFGKAIAHAYYQPETKEVHYVLDSLKSEKGRLDIVRKVADNLMTMMIQWYPSSEDDTIYISHHRIYTRKGPQVTLSDITQKAQRRQLVENMRDSPINTTIGVATDASKMAASVPLTFASSLSSRFRKGSTPQPMDDAAVRATFTKPAKQTNSEPSPVTDPAVEPMPLDKRSSHPIMERQAGIPAKSGPSNSAEGPDAVWKALLLPVSAFVLSMLLFIIFVKFGTRPT